MFIDYPIAQLHPDAFRAHEAANCAGEQGKYWEMHAQLFEAAVTRGVGSSVVAGRKGRPRHRAVSRACLDSGKYAGAVRESVSRMQTLGVDSTPTFLIGLTPAQGSR